MNESELISKAMSVLGKRTSKRKASASRENAKLGGWPKGKKRPKRKLKINA